jgi:hypothetical protein
MAEPAYYGQSIDVTGTLADCKDLLDPRKWAERSPNIWFRSFFTKDLETDVGSDPRPDEALATQKDRLFFEDVAFSLQKYRNVLAITVDPSSNESLGYGYNEHQCLTTAEVSDPEDTVLGGVDVDSGFARAKITATGEVRISIEKSVRFTQPAELAPDLNALAHVLVPLVLDTWLHTIYFKD